MTQVFLNKLWSYNFYAVRRHIGIEGLTCLADSFEEVLTFNNRTWHRRSGTQRWHVMRPLLGNL